MNTAAIQFNEYATLAFQSSGEIPTVSVDETRGWAYCRAAEEDERNGFPFTAAMEWHKAAACFGSQSPVSDRCWREWERIMRIPRALASAVVDIEEAVLPSRNESDSRPCGKRFRQPVAVLRPQAVPLLPGEPERDRPKPYSAALSQLQD